MGIMVESLVRVMQDLYHQPYFWGSGIPQTLKIGGFQYNSAGRAIFEFHEPKDINPRSGNRCILDLAIMQFRVSLGLRI